MAKYRSPKGLAIFGVLESCPCVAHIDDIADDGKSVTYGTTGSEMDWDSQKPVERDSGLVFVDEDGNEWSFEQLVKDDS